MNYILILKVKDYNGSSHKLSSGTRILQKRHRMTLWISGFQGLLESGEMETECQNITCHQACFSVLQ